MKLKRVTTQEELVYARSIHDLLFEAETWDPNQAKAVWLVWNNSEPVGFCSIDETDMAPEAAFVSYIGLLASARGRGLGRRMVRTCTKWARDAGYSRIVSYTWVENVSSARSFLREGWEYFYPENTASGYIWFEKKLDPPSILQ